MGERLDADLIRRALTDPNRLVAALGIDERAERQTHAVKILCPWHAERTPSCSVSLGTDGTVRVHCFGCRTSGDAFSLVAIANGLHVQRDFPTVLERAAEVAGMSGCATAKTRTPTISAPPPPRDYPPAHEVKELLAMCTPVYDDLALHRDVTGRSIDPATVTDRSLAFALSGQTALPRWARSRGGSWVETEHRLIIPMYDARGKIVTVRARRLSPATDGPKALPPAGFRHTRIVMADPLGRLLLAGGDVSWWTEPTIVIAEGEPDWLTIATHYGDDENAPAVLGVLAGSWSVEFAARIPDGARVIIRTHADPAGHKYASEIRRSLGTRCHLFRSSGVTSQEAYP